MPAPQPPPDVIRPVRLVVVDQHAVWRAGVRAVLARDPDMRVVGETAVAADAVLLVERLRPAVVLLDPTIRAGGGIAGLELCRELRERNPGCRVLVLSPVADDRCVLAAVAAGVAGSLSKEVDPDRFVAAVRAVAAGRGAFDRASTAALLRGRAGQAADTGLTGRQLDVLRLLAAGRSNRDIAAELALSEGTVKFHLARITRLLGVSGRTAAVFAASRRGLL